MSDPEHTRGADQRPRGGKRSAALERFMAALKSDTTAAVINLINVLNFFGIAATVIAVWFAYNALEEQRLATA